MAKELLTRIALKYDTYANWTDDAKGAKLKLLKGELGICEVKAANTDAHESVVPTVLFKVGDGEHEFKDLPWASAKAADVYSWAKASEVKRDGKKLIFVGGKADGSNLEIAFDYATLDDVKTSITNGLASRIADLESEFETNGTVADHESRLGIIEGEGAGSIKKAEADAKAYAKDYADGLASNYDASGSAATAEQNAKDYADDLDEAMDERVGILEAADAAFTTRIDAIYKVDGTSKTGALADEITRATGAEAALGGRIDGVITAYGSADAQVKTDLIGGDTDATQAKTIAGAKAFATAAVNTLANGQVATNTADIADLKTSVGNEVSTRKEITDDHEGRISAMEAFFEGAAADEGEGENLKNALDTLKEIQEFATGEGAAAQEMLGAISANAQAIEALQDIVKDGGTLEVRVDEVEAAASANAGAITTLQELVFDYSGKGAIKTAIEAAAAKGQTGIDNAATAQSAAEAAQDAADAAQADVDDLAEVVNNTTTGLAATKGIADGAASEASRLAAIVDTGDNANSKLRSDITTLQGIVSTGNDSNAKLREAITDLQGIVKTGADANATLRANLTTLQGVVNHATTGLVATKVIADRADAKSIDNANRIKAIEDDYLKQADEFIFNCGTSTTVIHEKAVQE